MFATLVLSTGVWMMLGQQDDPNQNLNPFQIQKAQQQARMKAKLAQNRAKLGANQERARIAAEQKAISEKQRELGSIREVICTSPAIISRDQTRFREFAALTGDPEAVAAKVNYVQDTIEEKHMIDRKSVRGTAINRTAGQAAALTQESNGSTVDGRNVSSQAVRQGVSRTDTGVDSIRQKTEIVKRPPVTLADDFKAIWPGDKARIIRKGYDTVDVEITDGQSKGFKGTTSILIFVPDTEVNYENEKEAKKP